MGCHFIRFGKFDKFFLLILSSAILKLLINSLFKLEFHNRIEIDYISILKQPVLNDHIFIRFIYYYFGFIILSLLFLWIEYSKEKNSVNFSRIKENELDINDGESEAQKKRKLIYHNYIRDKAVKSFPILIYIILAYIINEMILFYFDQKNYGSVNFWVLEIFFIYFLFYKKIN